MGKFVGGLDHGVFVGEFGEWDGFGEERDGVYDAFGMCAWYPDAIALVMVEGWAKVPAIGAMWGPSWRVVGFSWMMTRVPGGARGVREKLKGPLSWA